MTHDEPLTHAAFREQIAAFLTGGLDAEEQARFDAHAAACEACAAELTSAQQAEDRMTALFTSALPPMGFEDGLIQRLRLGSSRRGWNPWAPLRYAPGGAQRSPGIRSMRIHPAIARATAGVAAVLALAGMGYVVNQAVEESSANRVKTASNLRQIDRRTLLYSNNDNRGINARRSLVRQSVGFTMNSTIGAESAAPADMDFGVTKDGPMANGAPPQSQAGKSLDPHYYFTSPAARAPALNSTIKEKSVDRFSDARGTVINGGTMDTKDLYFDFERSRKEHEPVEDLAQKLKPTQFSLSELGDQVAALPGHNVVAGVVVEGPTAAPAPAAPAKVGQSPTAAYDASDSISLPEQTPALVALAPAPAAPATPPAPPTEAAATTRKVIRNGQIEFEVDRFDAAFAQVSKLVTEAGGYVGTTDSEKLPNGKVKGTVTVRVPPDRLDTLVLQLRGIGDLKSQKLEAQDVTKQYTDLESQLRAAKAMEERLIAIIKEGKGQIKDLLAAEKELGIWRTKVEELIGTMRFYDNQVSLSTLNITLYERDIKTPATAFETETIDAGVESQDVEKARAEALKAIEDAKGRVIQSDMKRYDAGQFGATIVAEVPPDAAGPLLDRIKQIGKMARLDVQRKQTAQSDPAGNAPVRVEKRPTRLNLSLYNLANVAPRQTTTLNLAADDVEAAYRAIVARVNKAAGRVVTSNLARNKPEQTTGTISFEVPSAEADAVALDVRANAEVMKLSVTENRDVQNATTAKRGFSVTLISTAAVAPRENMTIQLAAGTVAAAREKILAAAAAGGARVLSSTFNENDSQNVSAAIDLDVKRASLAALEKALADAGQVVSRVSTRSTDTENTLDSKLRVQMTVIPADKLPARETTTLAVETRDVEAAMLDLQTAAAEKGARVAESNLSKDRDGRSTAKVVVEAPLDKAGELVSRAKGLGTVRAVDASKNLQVPAGALSRARIEVTFGNTDAIITPDSGIWASIRQGLSTSVAGLMWSLRLIVIGVCFVLPWVLALAIIWRFIKRRSRTAPAAAPMV
jgi:hypothetical protein